MVGRVLVVETGEDKELFVDVGGLGFVLDTVTTHLGFLIVPSFDHFRIGGAIGGKQDVFAGGEQSSVWLNAFVG